MPRLRSALRIQGFGLDVEFLPSPLHRGFFLPKSDIVSENPPIEIKRSARRKRWSLQVRPGGGVRLSVPLRFPDAQIQEILKKYENWILEKHRALLKVNPLGMSQRWVDGETILFRGRPHTLRLGHAVAPRVRIEELTLYCELPNLQMHWVKNFVEEYFAKETGRMMEPLLQKWAARLELKQLPPLRLRKMRRSWGLCRSDGRISLHWHLSRQDPEFAEYVLVHELCHLFHMNHGPGFKQLLTNLLPHWRELKKKSAPLP